MEGMVLQFALCLLAACCLMIFHESIKVLVYMLCRKPNSSGKLSSKSDSIRSDSSESDSSRGNTPSRVSSRRNSPWRVSPWKFWRYVDPIGLILAVTCYVPVSKPFFFRIREKRTNLILGLTGLCFLSAVFGGSLWLLWDWYGGIQGLNRLVVTDFWELLPPIFLQNMALLSFGMLVANLFPISTFDLGLVVAGISAKAYLGIIKADSTIKIIFILTLLLGIIRYGAGRVIQFLI